MPYHFFFIIDIVVIVLLSYLIYLTVKRIIKYRRTNKQEIDRQNKTYVLHNRNVFVDSEYKSSAEYSDIMRAKTIVLNEITTPCNEEQESSPEDKETQLLNNLVYLSFLKGFLNEFKDKYSNIKNSAVNMISSLSPSKRIEVLKNYPELATDSVYPDADIGLTKLVLKAEELGLSYDEDIHYEKLYEIVDKICKEKWKKNNPIPHVLPAKCNSCTNWHTSDKRCDCGQRRQIAYIDGNWEEGYKWTAESF